MTDKVIIVGKNSYIGVRLAHYLLAIDSEVVSLSSSDCNFLHFEEVNALFRSFGNDPVTVVFLAVIKKDASNDYKVYLDNIALVNNLIQAGSRANIRSIVYLSSVDVYGRNPGLPIIEQTKIDPDTWYGLAKYTCEWMLMYSGAVSCPVTILRIPGIFGKAHNDNSVIGRMVASASAEGRIAITGGGDALRDYVYIDDLCKLIPLLLRMEYRGVINIATGKSRTILEIAKCIEQVLHADLEIVDQAGKDERSFDLAFDNSRLKSLFPRFRFRELAAAISTYV